MNNLWDDYEGFTCEAYEEAYALAKNVGLYISNDKELYDIEVDDLGNLIGASFVSLNQKYTSFDIAIHPEEQGRGIGKQMIDHIITSIDGTLTDEFFVDCLNPAVAHILEKYHGFKLDASYGRTRTHWKLVLDK